MIPRYTRPELGVIWTDETKMETWRQVEVAASHEIEGPSAQDLAKIEAATFTVSAVHQREATTNHDLAAFVDVLAESAGEAGRWIHFGLTSSDVLDTALALQLQAAGKHILAGANELEAALTLQAKTYATTLCMGRTHGIHAEPTTFGLKLAGFAMEARRNRQRLKRAFEQVAVGALSGAVGTYSATSPDFEQRVLTRLGLKGEPISTQVVPRDRHAELLQAIALAGAGLERIATEIRHLQRTEVREVEEPFRSGQQKGSSAMPHKRNPIASEQICGLARILRADAQVALENVALWHERDISHSAPERVIFADATILLDYLQHRLTKIITGLVVHVDRMRRNIDITFGAVFSQRLLLALIQQGLSRDDSYRVVQRLAQRAWDEELHIQTLIEATVQTQLEDLPSELANIDLTAVFNFDHYTRYAKQIISRLESSG